MDRRGTRRALSSREWLLALETSYFAQAELHERGEGMAHAVSESLHLLFETQRGHNLGHYPMTERLKSKCACLVSRLWRDERRTRTNEGAAREACA